MHGWLKTARLTVSKGSSKEFNLVKIPKTHVGYTNSYCRIGMVRQERRMSKTSVTACRLPRLAGRYRENRDDERICFTYQAIFCPLIIGILGNVAGRCQCDRGLKEALGNATEDVVDHVRTVKRTPWGTRSNS